MHKWSFGIELIYKSGMALLEGCRSAPNDPLLSAREHSHLQL